MKCNAGLKYVKAIQSLVKLYWILPFYCIDLGRKLFVNSERMLMLRDHLFISYTKFSEKLTFLTPPIRKSMRAYHMVEQFCVRTK